jgi:hypothetical protein
MDNVSGSMFAPLVSGRAWHFLIMSISKKEGTKEVHQTKKIMTEFLISRGIKNEFSQR